MSVIIDLFLHLDTHLQNVIETYGMLTYVILFLIIFLETGIVVMPFLPGDSLLFAAGAFAASGHLSLGLLFALLFAAAVAGDALNFLIGSYAGPKAYESRFLKKEHLDRTHAFFQKYGNKTIIFARFAPIIRTVAPFVAGAGKMDKSLFFRSNILGGFLWISLFLLGGYFFGNVPFVRDHFEIVIIGIIVLSLLPAVIEAVRHRKSAR